MLKKYIFLAAAVMIVSGCPQAFMLGDKPVHVSGIVRDESGLPLKDAAVEFYGVRKSTGEDGRFYFGGVLGAQGFILLVDKPGFKPYKEARNFAYYDITVTLAAADSDRDSSGDWRILDESELESSRK